ncbi:hypothetical protein IE81DRAFT_292456 [Ceraceosorus guamensis]|uniref:Acyltransferase MbtK/IucB-like conserved domain-containing protein n=1 Tax=Ceraceosorus guamensis TaxID=1522189 RepID=A0A316VXP0_9BASI|nr:hypothetical protein IE81DRAFT_292456 [Ceraceosorus guamensis]PWN41061.1 hypothetical protein IE81DRAFT_292456 [Ceraceosorus guamensis]
MPKQKDAELKPLALFRRAGGEDARKARVSLHGAVNDDRAKHEQVWQLDAPQDQSSFELSPADTWAALYAFWIRNDFNERLPVELGTKLSNRDHILAYLTHTGLGFRAPDAVGRYELLWDRSAFWQGAGAPLGRSWLQAPLPAADAFGPLTSTSFPHTLSFTKSDNPPVLTAHPLRPPKPAPGSIVYSRYIHSVKQHLTLTHINPDDPKHFEAYCRWQNSDHVNKGWRERGSEDYHRQYHKGRLADPHIMGYILSWDGEPAGYGEASFNKEDGMAAFVGGMGDYDQGTHLLIGESKFRGRHRFASSMVSMKHFCFLRESRTHIVIGEPRFDLPIIPLLAQHLPQSWRREVELPHKRAVLFLLHRDRFFDAGPSGGIFY